MSNLPSVPSSRHPLRWLLLPITLLLIGGAAGGYYAYVLKANRPEPVDELQTLRGFIAKLPQGQKLAAGYADANGDLVADAPADPSKQRPVDELGFSLIAGDDPDKTQEEWHDLIVALEKATGKKVIHRGDLMAEEAQLAALRDGKLHITAFSTGEVVTAVNTAGFVPLWTPADAEGKYSFEMEILVPAASPIKSPADLRGKTLAFTNLSSNSGAKAPMVILKEKFGLLPGRDYKYLPTGGHVRSIKELKEGRREAVCVANDLLAQELEAGHIQKEQYRSIFKSDSFPPLCLGIAHDLPTDIAAKVKQVFQDFRFEGTSLAKRYRAPDRVRFALVDYKRDWAYVRQIDDSLTRLLDGTK